MRGSFAFVMRIAVALVAVGVWPLTAGLCPAASVTLRIEPTPPTTVSPGGTVHYQVKCSVSAGDNQGLATIGFDLETDPGVTLGAVLSGPDMARFIIPVGYTNPTGFGGTADGGNIRGIGGAQNTIGYDGSDPNITYPTGTVTSGLGQTSEIVIATGQITLPQEVGTYTVSLANAFAGVLRSGATGAPHPVDEADVTLSPASFEVTVSSVIVTPGSVPTFVYEGWTVNLTATAQGPVGSTLTFDWAQTSGREVTNFTEDPNTGNASFTVPRLQLTNDAPLRFTVTTSDGQGGSDSREVTVYAYMMGDVNHDNYVNVGDMQLVTGAWGSGPGYSGPADLNRDGWVNVGDLQCVSGNWGRSLGAVAVWFTSIPGYVYEGQSAGVTCSVRSIHGDPWTCTWTQSGGWSVVGPTGAATPTYSFTVPALLCATDTPLKFTVSVTAGQDGTAIGSVAVPAYMLGDLNFNGVVASSGPGSNNDRGAMQAAMGSHPGDPNWKAQADFDRDNDVDEDDWDLVPSWSRTLAPPVTITSATASPSFAYEGQQVNLACEASNPHGLPLVYEWCWDSGAYVEPTNLLTANASFTVPTLTHTYDTPIAFYIWADDGSSYWAYEYVAANVYLMGDVDHDADVDSADAAAVTAAMGTHPGETGWNAAADLDGDGVITSADQQAVTTNTGRALVESQGLMGGSFGGESLSVAAAMDGVETLAGDTPAGAAAGPVDSYGLTFEQALQSVGLLEEWQAYQASQSGQ